MKQDVRVMFLHNRRILSGERSKKCKIHVGKIDVAGGGWRPDTESFDSLEALAIDESEDEFGLTPRQLREILVHRVNGYQTHFYLATDWEPAKPGASILVPVTNWEFVAGSATHLSEGDVERLNRERKIAFQNYVGMKTAFEIDRYSN